MHRVIEWLAHTWHDRVLRKWHRAQIRQATRRSLYRGARRSKHKPSRFAAAFYAWQMERGLAAATRQRRKVPPQ